jgi:hypothetical protein
MLIFLTSYVAEKINMVNARAIALRTPPLAGAKQNGRLAMPIKD